MLCHSLENVQNLGTSWLMVWVLSYQSWKMYILFPFDFCQWHWLNTYLTILNQSSLWEWIDLGNKIFTAIRLCSIANSCKNLAGGSLSVFTKCRIWQVKNILQNSHILTISITFTDCRELFFRKIVTQSKPIYQFIIQDGKSLCTLTEKYLLARIGLHLICT